MATTADEKAARRFRERLRRRAARLGMTVEEYIDSDPIDTGEALPLDKWLELVRKNPPVELDEEPAVTIRRFRDRPRSLGASSRACRVGAIRTSASWTECDTVTAPDAAHVALAEELDAPLVTTDTALGGASGCAARVEAYAMRR